MISWALIESGAAAICQQDYDDARAMIMDALALFQMQQCSNGLLACLDSLAALMAGEGRNDQGIGACRVKWTWVEWERQTVLRAESLGRAISQPIKFEEPT